ncbi:DUF6779 domain-containing protein [Actinomycetospora sp. TBRC 11914]|uniref:DUF6779 domain-containing protein n=1 Tax=Actinomycetospora sp. TBRC 11914 TaxID=2729387 RepID=UPI00145D2755|nr:DUF6779 domain-containing protein [Actinomycetospora sp. TBRC 11914]NMO89106.1 hypothetical protein [Actinomycetospora sp. TBRC 11914]
MAAADGVAAPDGRSGRRGPRPSSQVARRVDPVVRLLLTLTGLLGVIAAVVVVVGEDGRLLRLGVVAALWAALLAVAALVRRGARAGGSAEREEALRRTYELELAAEVDARREHELTVERAVRREVAAETAEEIAGLRGELERLRSHLERAEAASAPPRLRAVAGSERWAPVAPPTPPPSWHRHGPGHVTGERPRPR